MIIQRERFETIKEEIKPLWKLQYEEISDKAAKLNPHVEAYEQLEQMGGLVVMTVRDKGELIGYSFFGLQYSLHYKDLVVALNDLIFLHPDYRGQWIGTKLQKESERILAELGVHKVQMRTKKKHNFSNILIRQGYEEEEISLTKYLNLP